MSIKENARRFEEVIKGIAILREVYGELIQIEEHGKHRLELAVALSHLSECQIAFRDRHYQLLEEES